MSRKKPAGKFARVNGLNIYYETHGGGKKNRFPLVLLHGGVGGIEMFGPNLSLFARTRRVIAVNLQGHANTPDVERPLRFELMADDIQGLLYHLEIAKADLLGYSLGGGVALQTAIRHPEIVNKLVVASHACRRDGWYPEVLAGMAQMGPAVAEGMKQSPLAKLYPDVNWASLFAKLSELLKRDFDWSEDVASLKMPVMLVFADADSVSTAHIAEFYGLLGGGKRDAGLDDSARPVARLAILPGRNHYNIMATKAVSEVVNPFLDAA